MKRNLLSLACACGLVLAACLAGAQEEKTTTERIKDKAGSAVQSLKKGLNSAEKGLSDQYHKVRTAAVNMNVHARVYSRLHWDKALVNARIETEVTEDGRTTLKGTVPDAKARAKAVLLANDTVGVTEVVDRLTIQPVTETIETKTTTKTETKVEKP